MSVVVPARMKAYLKCRSIRGRVVAAHLGPRLPPLANDVADEERQGAGEGVGVGEVGDVRPET